MYTASCASHACLSKWLKTQKKVLNNISQREEKLYKQKIKIFFVIFQLNVILHNHKQMYDRENVSCYIQLNQIYISSVPSSDSV